jgi:hypothetical protein
MQEDKSMNELQHKYLVKCFTKSYEELIFRVKHRDNWLKTQLLSQLIISVLAFGNVEIGSVKSAQPLPGVLALAPMISLVIYIYYMIEENLIGRLSSYISDLSSKEKALSASETTIHNFDSSLQAKHFFDETQPQRIVGQVVGFILLPFVLLFILVLVAPLSSLSISILIISLIILCVIGYLIKKSHDIRSQAIKKRHRQEDHGGNKQTSNNCINADAE